MSPTNPRSLSLLIFASLFGFLLNCTALCQSQPSEDPYLWLEEVEGERSLAWVKAQNDATKKELGGAQFEEFFETANGLLTAADRIPQVFMLGNELYNFWQDKDHERGILRRTTLAEYRKPAPQWETVLDIDALSAKENTKWVWKHMDCLDPDYERCLVSLSPGGTDAVVVREFNLKTKDFIEGGFEIPQAKSYVAWLSKDRIVVATKFDDDSVTTSGYPRTVRVWNRGEALNAAKTIYNVEKDHVGVWLTRFAGKNHSPVIIEHRVSFFEMKLAAISPEAEVRILDLPLDAEIKGAYEDELFIHLKKAWKTGDREYNIASLIAVPYNSDAKPRVVLEPNDQQSIEEVVRSSDAVHISVLENVASKLVTFRKNADAWENSGAISLPAKGGIQIWASDAESDDLLMTYESFLVPQSLYHHNTKTSKTEKIRALPARFETKDLTVEQRFAESKDGTRVPYYVVFKADAKMDGSNPTLLYAYGGFEISIKPVYSPVHGKLWLEKGGVFAVANIRGGGEFGPKWHHAALKINRQRAYDDFAAVSEHLISTGVTSSQHLGIMGGSNGGLLVGVAMTQRPDLYAGVVCLVPLLDMIRYTKLPPGASWMGEYGDPEDPAMRDIIAKYSPYQNVKEGSKYPSVLFYTSTKDDRVHPGHARKMAHKLIDLGNPVLYYENIEGGHAGSATLNQKAHERALEFTYLWKKLK